MSWIKKIIQRAYWWAGLNWLGIVIVILIIAIAVLLLTPGLLDCDLFF